MQRVQRVPEALARLESELESGRLRLRVHLLHLETVVEGLGEAAESLLATESEDALRLGEEGSSHIINKITHSVSQ